MSFIRNVQNCCLGVGANNVAYLPDIKNPLFSYFGTGILPRFDWNVVQGQAFWVNPSQRVIGLPGIAVGSFIGQPLIDTRAGPL